MDRNNKFIIKWKLNFEWLYLCLLICKKRKVLCSFQKVDKVNDEKKYEQLIKWLTYMKFGKDKLKYFSKSALRERCKIIDTSVILRFLQFFLVRSPWEMLLSFVTKWEIEDSMVKTWKQSGILITSWTIMICDWRNSKIDNDQKKFPPHLFIID